jgi:hydrogenase/urease accessory protein HupE
VSRRQLAAAAAAGLAIAGLAAPDALAHSTRLVVPQQQTGIGLAFEFSKYGFKHILLGYDHILFLLGLAVLCSKPRDIVGLAALFAISYSTTLIGGTALGVSVPGDFIDAIIAVSVGFVGAQIAFGRAGRRLSRDPRPPALVFGLAHGLGLSALLQELQLPGDQLWPSVLGFNVGVEVGQVAVLVAFVGVLSAARYLPVPDRQRIPAGCALLSAASVLLTFVVTGVSL